MKPTIPVTVDSERQVVQRLLDLVRDRADREQQIEARHAAETAEEQQQFQLVYQMLTETYEAENATVQHGHATEAEAIHERWQAEADRVRQQFDQTLEQIRETWQAERDAAQKEHDDAHWLLDSLLDRDTADSPQARLRTLQSGMAASRTELETAVTTLDGWYRTATSHLQKCRLLSDATLPPPGALPIDQAGLHQACLESMRQAEPIQRRLAHRILPNLFRGFWPVLLLILCAAVPSALIWLLVPPPLIGLKIEATAQDWVWIATGAGSAIGLVIVFLVHLYAGHLTLPDYERLVQLAVDADSACQRWTAVAQRECEQQEAELQRIDEVREKQREAAVAHSNARLESRLAAANARHEAELQSANTSFPARLAEIERFRQHELQESEQRSTGARHDLLLRRERDFRNLQAEFDQRLTASRQIYQQSWGQLVRDWHGGLHETAAAADALCEHLQRQCPDWSTVLDGWLETRAQPDPADAGTDGALQIGRIIADLAAIPGGLSADPRLQAERSRFEFPLLLTLVDTPSLVVHADADSRLEAAGLLQSAMLRYLTSLPAGKVRFTIFDPVGLGANFASFMHLADFDEQLVTSRIWTEPAHIEKRLADLTEHMETVLQTYLRNEYSTLDDYNRAAGEVAEPYRVLVVANFPANFTDVALRRLISIAEGGGKCGVFVLMSVDRTQDLPRGISLSSFEQHATVLRRAESASTSAPSNPLTDLVLTPMTESAAVGSSGGTTPEPWALVNPPSPFRLADPILGRCPVILDRPPAADQFGQIVRRAGELALSVRRVEVPFDRVMPPADQFWMSSTRSGVTLPIGRAGATKLQQLRLGKGTSQHVLIAGKTGSGKSTLLHALITNAALHYSPDEIEFYLIDFKKGVEFKTYAAHRLPHARVIAIESDREFGVSVLQRLDALLKDRGELFRRAGVQDLAGFRDARPDQPLPRVLLIIDEFQEFFTEDDPLSQSASLLLDRLIRQGRAFGVHVLLGSQTLAGAYSLARSTLGQIAVRIALQCSDTDAHLILSEDNTAARLLSRPGEAIYNDANGLIEGNHPFQVVWLDDAQRETCLGWIQQWAGEYQSRLEPGGGSGPRWPESVVFEGNVPADPLSNPRLVTAVHRLTRRAAPGEAAADASRTCWLGDAVALTGPAQLQFGPRDGGPLLVIGHDEEAALGVLSNAVLALAGQGAAAARFVILDGSLPGSPSARTWQSLASLIPELTVAGPREAAATLQGIVDELHARQDAETAPLFVIAFDLARFRDLRKADDDFGGFGGFDKPRTASPSALLAEIVKDGPAAGIFPFAWCDGYQTAQRWLGRDLLNRFETRVLFAMNVNDSSNLIDSPAAGRLGPNRALLFRGDLGTLDKFRPYKPPSIGWLDEIRPTPVLAEEIQAPAPADPGTASPTPVQVSEEPSAPGAGPVDQPAADVNDVPDTWTDISELNVT